MKHCWGNIFAAVDVETTGTVPGHHEIVQIAVVPLDSRLEPVGVPFYTNVCPNYPERIDPSSWSIHGLDLNDLLDNAPSQERAADMLDEWFRKLDLPAQARLIPLSHNYQFEHGFLRAWLGHDLGGIFHYHPRDGMVLALALKDRAALLGEPIPFESVGLTNLCKVLGVTNYKPHDALADSLAEAEVYRTLLRL